jgi:hypothetical protein
LLRPLRGAAWPFGLLGFAAGVATIAAASREEACDSPREPTGPSETRSLAEDAADRLDRAWTKVRPRPFIEPSTPRRTAGKPGPVRHFGEPTHPVTPAPTQKAIEPHPEPRHVPGGIRPPRQAEQPFATPPTPR